MGAGTIPGLCRWPIWYSKEKHLLNKTCGFNESAAACLKPKWNKVWKKKRFDRLVLVSLLASAGVCVCVCVQVFWEEKTDRKFFLIARTKRCWLTGPLAGWPTVSLGGLQTEQLTCLLPYRVHYPQLGRQLIGWHGQLLAGWRMVFLDCQSAWEQGVWTTRGLGSGGCPC